MRNLYAALITTDSQPPSEVLLKKTAEHTELVAFVVLEPLEDLVLPTAETQCLKEFFPQDIALTMRQKKVCILV
jgi:hypothetical protein